MAKIPNYFQAIHERQGFSFISKTKNFLDPYFRFKLFLRLNSMKRNLKKIKKRSLNYYNSIGYRDAIIEDVKPYPVSSGNMNVDFKVSEGHKYYFGNITWKGNTKYLIHY